MPLVVPGVPHCSPYSPRVRLAGEKAFQRQVSFDLLYLGVDCGNRDSGGEYSKRKVPANNCAALVADMPLMSWLLGSGALDIG